MALYVLHELIDELRRLEKDPMFFFISDAELDCVKDNISSISDELMEKNAKTREA